MCHRGRPWRKSQSAVGFNPKDSLGGNRRGAKDRTGINNVASRLKGTTWTVIRICNAEGLGFPQ